MLPRIVTKLRSILAVGLVVAASASTTSHVAAADESVVYRVQVGGAAQDGSPRWTRDTRSTPSRFLDDTGTTTHRTLRAIDLSSPSLPAGLPEKLFKTSRSSSGASLKWSFPVTPGEYQVRLFFAEISQKPRVGDRVFDVMIEASTVLKNYDVFARVGSDKGQMRSFAVSSDSLLNIALKRVAGDPSLNGLEIVQLATEAEAEPEPTPVPEPTPAPEPTSCEGIQVSPGANLVSLISGVTNKTFCIRAGTYNIGSDTIKVGNGTKLIGDTVSVSGPGVISAPTKIVGNGRGGIIDLGQASGVVLENLDISGAVGTKLDTDKSTKQEGRGIQGGEGLVARYLAVHDNDNTGIAGIGPNTVLDHIELYGNGSSSYLGCCSGGIKAAQSYTISNSYIHDNDGWGVWQDVAASDLVVVDNTILRNSFGGVRYEHNQDSPGRATILRNIIKDNNTSRKSGDAGGVVINSAPNALVANNVFGGNEGVAVDVRGNRGPVTGTNIRDNFRNGDILKGCDLSGVSCTNNP